MSNCSDGLPCNVLCSTTSSEVCYQHLRCNLHWRFHGPNGLLWQGGLGWSHGQPGDQPKVNPHGTIHGWCHGDHPWMVLTWHALGMVHGDHPWMVHAWHALGMVHGMIHGPSQIWDDAVIIRWEDPWMMPKVGPGVHPRGHGLGIIPQTGPSWEHAPDDHKIYFDLGMITG